MYISTENNEKLPLNTIYKFVIPQESLPKVI